MDKKYPVEKIFIRVFFLPCLQEVIAELFLLYCCIKIDKRVQLRFFCEKVKYFYIF
jgi:hypothetical protein